MVLHSSDDKLGRNDSHCLNIHVFTFINENIDEYAFLCNKAKKCISLNNIGKSTSIINKFFDTRSSFDLRYHYISRNKATG